MSTYIDGAADYVAASEQKLREAVKYKQAKVHSRMVRVWRGCVLTLFLLTAMCGFVTAENENEGNSVIVCFCSLLFFFCNCICTHFQYNMHPDLNMRSCHLPNARTCINNNMFCQHLNPPSLRCIVITSYFILSMTT